VGIEGSEPKFLYSTGDLEGHVGRDGFRYILDLARAFPPETPSKADKASFLYKLLRPEFVR